MRLNEVGLLLQISVAVNGYRAVMWFDPATQNGIVMLWNSGSTRPFRLPYEFFDQIYGRSYSDWMAIDKDPRFIDPEPLPPAIVADATILAD